MATRKIKIAGERKEHQKVDHVESVLELKESFLILGSQRGITKLHTVDLEDEDVVELVFEDETTWLSSPENLEELFPRTLTSSRSITDGFELPTMLEGEADSRGIINNILLKSVKIFSKKAVGSEVRKLAQELEKKQLDNSIGLFRLDQSFNLQPYASDGIKSENYLLFIHGTSSSTKGSFGDILNTKLWESIQDQFGKQVLAFQHESITKSPFENVLELIKKLPSKCDLQLITHSRGGLIGEILSRFSLNRDGNNGFNTLEMKYLEKTKRDKDIELIKQIRYELRNKSISISKFVRVACPAAGTVLASKRLDHFLNFSLNLIGIGSGLAVNPYYYAFRDLIAAVIDTKNDPDILPGLEAMNPDSPFIKVLGSPIGDRLENSDLFIISGNCKTKLNLKALLIIASKLFYKQENDLVVNTSSMYLGTVRLNPVYYFFDENSEVDHFSYFKNNSTNSAISEALKNSENVLKSGFKLLNRDLVADKQRNAVLGLDGGEVFEDEVSGSRPIVVLLPGIMGSNLKINNNLYWINYLRFLNGELSNLNIEEQVDAASLIKSSYKKLVDHLLPNYDVVTFPFDWRQSLTATASLFDSKIKELLRHNQPIKIIAHSMGGVLVRDYILNFPESWKKLNASEKFKLIFLGAPLGGSFRIPSVLFGQDAIIRKLSKIDLRHTCEELVDLFSKMPGLLCLLPVMADPENDFSDPDVWKKMSVENEWPLPQSADLVEFSKYREKIINGNDTIDVSNMVYIAGKDKATPCAYKINETKRGKELVFLSTAEGDQSVTWESGIPRKMIEKDLVYYVNVTHGSLANEDRMFGGIDEILLTGSTNKFSKIRPSVRAVEKLFIAPIEEDFDLSPRGIEKTLLGIGETQQIKQDVTTIGVSISNGHLRYAKYPVLAGHFLRDGIVSAERAIDRCLDNILSEKNKLGIYVGEIGSSEFIDSKKDSFPGALIVGLGELGKLTGYRIQSTIENGITKYLVDHNRRKQINSLAYKHADRFGISCLLIGSGYGGFSIEVSMRSILQGINNANEKIKNLYKESAICIEHVEFIEMYEDTALNAFYSVMRILNEQDKSMLIKLEQSKIKKLFGSRKQLTDEASSGWWKRLTVTDKTDHDKMDNNQVAVTQQLQFSISTGGAGEEQDELFISRNIVDQGIEELSSNNNWSPSLAKIIFELFVPITFKEQLKAQANICWILEEHTAEYPWELLHDASSGDKPFCVNAGMVRQLLVRDFRQRPNFTTNNNAFVVGDPNLEGAAPQLSHALEEAKFVSGILEEHGYVVEKSLSEKSFDIIKKQFQNDYKIIHLSGHGVFNKSEPMQSGMLIGKNAYLTPCNIKQMSFVPELAFVNCCYLGQINTERHKLAANIGTQLIKIGVKAVVVAGWAIHDDAAFEFAKEFYKNMFSGDNFGDAIRKSRRRIFDDFPQTNTWGAYQCYGDPYYKINEASSESKPRKYVFVIPEEALIELSNLYNELEMNLGSISYYLDKLNSISLAVRKANIVNSNIIEMEALIYSELQEFDLAIEKYNILMKMENANYSVSALERFCNIRAKSFVAKYMKEGKRDEAVLKNMDEIILDLKQLLKISPTAERCNLIASIYKRKAILATDKLQKQKALADAAFYYHSSVLRNESDSYSYSMANWIQIECLLVMSEQHKWGEKIINESSEYQLPDYKNCTKMVFELEGLTINSGNSMNYWSLISKANVKLTGSLLKVAGAGHKSDWDGVVGAYHKIWDSAGSINKRMSEIEHFEILLDSLDIIAKDEVKEYSIAVKKLKDDLYSKINN